MTTRFPSKNGFYVVLFVMLLSSVASVQAQATTVSMPEVTEPSDSYATLPITLLDVQNYGTGTISITYDPTVVHVTGVSDGPDSTVIDWNPNNTSGIVIISAWNMDGVSGDIIFADVTFHAVGSSGTSTTLKLNVTTLKDISINDIPASISDGTFNIKSEGKDITPTSTSTPPAPTPTPQGKIPGFESIFACTALLIACLFLLLMRMRKRGGDSV